MKKTIYIFLLLFAQFAFSPPVSAPVPENIVIINPSPVNPYSRLIYAIGMAENKCDTMAYNAVEMATGFFQIRPIRLEDYNNRTGSRYTLNDMFNYVIAEKVFLYYADKIGPYNYEKIARNWNGSGKKTLYYWNKVKKYL
jgi:hypothetical protein